MTKESFIQEIKHPMKALGFRKNGNYWYRTKNDLLQCVYVQGSQWDKNDYYVEIGAALVNSNRHFPTLLHWEFSHRCVDLSRESNCDINVSPAVLLTEIKTIFSDLTTAAHLPEYYQRHNAIRIANRYEIFYPSTATASSDELR